MATLLGSVYSLMQFLFVPVWGRVSDRFGRRPVLLWSIAGTALTMAGLGASLAWGSSIAWLFAARIFGGIATANLGTASAYIADITKPEERAKGMGLIGMAFGLGFILGPGIGGALAQIPVDGRHGAVPCFVAAGLSVVNLVWVALRCRRVAPAGEARRQRRAGGSSPLNVDALRASFALPGVGLAIALNFLVILSFTNLDQTFTFFCGDVFGIDERGHGVRARLHRRRRGRRPGRPRAPARQALRRSGAHARRVRSCRRVAFAGFVAAATLGARRCSTRPGAPARARQRADPADDLGVHLAARASRRARADARHQPVLCEPRADVRPRARRLALRKHRRARPVHGRVVRHGARVRAGHGAAQAGQGVR